MFRAYINILAIFLGLSNFVVLASAWGNGREVTTRDFLVPAAVLFVLVSLVFVLRMALRQRDSKIIARALARQKAQIANFKTALGRQTLGEPEFSRGLKPWNS